MNCERASEIVTGSEPYAASLTTTRVLVVVVYTLLLRMKKLLVLSWSFSLSSFHFCV
jgi:hypothetical protein